MLIEWLGLLWWEEEDEFDTVECGEELLFPEGLPPPSPPAVPPALGGAR